MACPRCIKRGKDWNGDDPQCAFESGEFSSDNWNCATMNDLREIVYSDCKWSEDQHCALIPTDGSFLVLGWYKSRGRTEFAMVVRGSESEALTLAFAEECLASNEPAPGDK